MIDIKIGTYTTKCENFDEVIFVLRCNKKLNHLDDIKKLYRQASNKFGFWVDNYKPFSTAQFKHKNHPDFGPQQFPATGEKLASDKAPVMLGVRITF